MLIIVHLFDPKTVKTAILWNNITIKNNCLKYLKCIYSCDAKLNFTQSSVKKSADSVLK